MKRRVFLHLTIMAGIGLAGCQRSKKSVSTTTEQVNKILAIFPEVQKVSSGWKLEAMVINEYAPAVSFHDIHLLGFSAGGEKVCEVQVGNLLKPAGDKKTVETTCSAFPAIITATARESPCNNAYIPVDYWVGTEAQKTESVAPDVVLWKDTYRKCGGEIPPQRVLDKFETTTSEKS